MAAPKFDNFKKYFNRKKPSIQEIVREPTAGGVVFRRNQDNEVEILLIQDAKDRWTIPKGHIEEGETAQQTANVKLAKRQVLRILKFTVGLAKYTFVIVESINLSS